MKRAVMRRALWGSTHFHRSYSRTADACAAAADVHVIPKMPPFNYTPPPYTGPAASEILAKRKEFLSPSMFYFYTKPVSLSGLPCTLAHLITPLLSLSNFSCFVSFVSVSETEIAPSMARPRFCVLLFSFSFSPHILSI